MDAQGHSNHLPKRHSSSSGQADRIGSNTDNLSRGTHLVAALQMGGKTQARSNSHAEGVWLGLSPRVSAIPYLL